MGHFKMSILILFVAFNFGRSTEILEPSYDMPYGQWHPWVNCTPGTYANGFQIKADKPAQPLRDDVGMTNVKLFCQDKDKMETNSTESNDLGSGNWKDIQMCPSGQWLTGFRLRVEKYKGWIQDDTGANDLEMICESEMSYIGGGISDGEWLDWVNCTKGEIICGVQSKMENKLFTDHLGLVSLKMKCCSRSSYQPNINEARNVGNEASGGSPGMPVKGANDHSSPEKPVEGVAKSSDLTPASGTSEGKEISGNGIDKGLEATPDDTHFNEAATPASPVVTSHSSSGGGIIKGEPVNEKVSPGDPAKVPIILPTK